MTYVSQPVFGYVTFCEDVRFEIGGKRTLVGIYNAEMIFPVGHVWPTILPKLVVDINFSEPIDAPFTPTIFKIFNVDQEDSKDGPSVAAFELPQPTTSPDDSIDRSMARRFVSIPVVFSPFQLNGPGHVRVRAFRGDAIMRLGALNIRTFSEVEQDNLRDIFPYDGNLQNINLIPHSSRA